MPKYLFLCRHADTAPAASGEPDFNRPLTPQGVQDAQRAGAWILNQQLPVSAIICSAAVRTTATARILAEALSFPVSAVQARPELYEADALQLEYFIQRLPGEQEVVIVVGHNPAVSRVVGKLNSHSNHYVPAGGVNFFTFQTDDWADVIWSEVRWQANY